MTRASFIDRVPGNWYLDGALAGFTLSKVYTSESVSGASRRKPLGWIPPTGYLFIRDHYERHEGELTYKYRWESDPWINSASYTGVVGASGVLESLGEMNSVYVPGGVPSSMRDQAIIKARLQMKSQKINLGQAFAEREQTARLVGDTALRFLGAIRAIRRGDVAGACDALGISARAIKKGSPFQMWLELQYGWKPLLSDIYGALDTLCKLPREKWIITGKGSVRESGDSGYVETGYYYGWAYGRGLAKWTRGVDVRIDAVPENDFLHSLSEVGITNPVLIAWELVPWSFVADWFVGVGDFISSMDAMLGYGETYCSIASLDKSEIIHELASSEWQQYQGGLTVTHSVKRTGTAKRDRVYLYREALTTVPLPTLPRLKKNPFSFTHMANAISLLAGALLGGRGVR